MARVRSSRRLGLSGVLAALAIGTLSPASVVGAQPADAGGSTTAKFIVTYDAQPGDLAKNKIERLGGKVKFELDIVNGLAVDLPPGQLKKVRDDSTVRSVEPDGTIVAFDHSPNTGDLEYENAWGVEHIGSREVHQAGNTGQGIKVAVIDTGIDYIHNDPDDLPYVVDPEFNGIYAGGEDFLTFDGDPYDDNGHGTHVSGILAAAKNGYLVTGVAHGVELYALKVLDANGEGDYSGLIAALDWAVANDIDVVNMSLGGHEASAALQTAVTSAYDAGVALVAASGNVNPANFQELLNGCPVAYPAAYDEVTAVSFTGTADKLTGFSCTGPQMDLAAPGDQIRSTVPVGQPGSCMFCTPQGYSVQSGTSMASPHVAGVVALVLRAGIADADGDGLLADDVMAHLCANTMPAAGMVTTDPRYSKWYGCGIVDADKALLDNPPPPPGDVPQAADDAAALDEDTATDVAVLDNDTAPNGEALSVVAVSDPAHGTAATNPDDTVHYTPDADYAGPDSFDYTIADTSGKSASATVAVTIAALNDAPVAVADNLVTLVDTSSTIDVLANDADVDGDSLSTSNAGAASHGATQLEADGSITYTPNAGYVGDDGFDYTASDGAGGNATGTVSVSVVSTNGSPVAADDMFASPEDEVATIDVLANDLDPDGGTLSVTSVTQPSNGSASIGTGGEIVYAPMADFHGTDALEYTVADSIGLTDTGSVAITVEPANDAPIAANDNTSTNEDTPKTIDVTANDTDVDGDHLTVTTVGAPGAGTAAIGPDGTVTYTPVANYNGADAFTYTITDEAGGSDEASVSVNVSAVNDAPTAADKTVTTTYQKSAAVTMTGTDAETCNLSFQIVAPPAHGTLTTPSNILCVTLLPPYADSSKVTYTPAAGYSGSDSFTYRTSDGSAQSSPATVSITVGPPPRIHVGDIDQSRLVYTGSWTAIATVRVHTEAEVGRGGVTVVGTWSDGVSAAGTCKTTSGGCQVKLASVSKTIKTARFTVTGLTYTGYIYDPSVNHDPDGESDGTTIIVIGPP